MAAEQLLLQGPQVRWLRPVLILDTFFPPRWPPMWTGDTLAPSLPLLTVLQMPRQQTTKLSQHLSQPSHCIGADCWCLATQYNALPRASAECQHSPVPLHREPEPQPSHQATLDTPLTAVRTLGPQARAPGPVDRWA